LVERLRKEIPGGNRARVIAHGGLAELMARVTPCIDVADPNLICVGCDSRMTIFQHQEMRDKHEQQCRPQL